MLLDLFVAHHHQAQTRAGRRRSFAAAIIHGRNHSRLVVAKRVLVAAQEFQLQKKSGTAELMAKSKQMNKK